VKYTVLANGVESRVELREGVVLLNGEPIDAAFAPGTQTHRGSLRVGNTTHRVVWERRRAGEPGSGAAFRIWIDGEAVDVSAMDERAATVERLRRAAAQPHQLAPVVAPMPGLVVRVHVSVGQEVAAGQGVVVIEAMKMENELRATAAGVVRHVHARAGLAVEKGAILIELE
jgi:pyruvate carboxylase subunit B